MQRVARIIAKYNVFPSRVCVLGKQRRKVGMRLFFLAFFKMV